MAIFSRHVEKQNKSHANRQLIKSPAFSSLWQVFSDEQKYRILDLGAASGANIAFFSALRCKLFVGDVTPTILSYQKSLTDDVPASLLLRDMLDLDDLSELDLIMCWDIINYLDTRLIEPFSAGLHQLMAKGGYLHAFIYTQKEMPAGPGTYQILDSSQMNVEYPAGSKIPGPGYALRELERRMPGFTIKQSRLLLSGMQEYIFTRQ
ncbi:MAG TPA: hypothetical protein DDW45_00630 [Gammaproteobacteria bacterium]|nr:hypothetical protein [Gammaproteobacteria bacterium]